MKKTIITIIITALISCMVVNTLRDIRQATAHSGAERKVQAVLDIVDNVSIYNTEGTEMGDAAARAMLAALDDEYTHYYSKEEYASIKDDFNNSYVGIGVTVGPDQAAKKVKIIAVTEGQIAEQMGILSGDYITAVEGTRYSDKEMQALVAAIKGENGTTVTITIERDGVEFELTVERKVIDIETVTSGVLQNDIGYVRISQFSGKNDDIEGAKDTYDHFAEQLEELKAKGIKSLVIDLRNNPGGSLEVVTNIADYLLPSGVITYTEDKNGKREYYDSEESALNLPMAVLINGGSASASEVLSGALRDYKLAILVGEKTFGKGVVQSVLPLYDGSGVIITSSRYFTPAGECIHEKGIEPDVKVHLDTEKSVSKLSYQEDLQLQKAVELLK